MKTQQQWEVWSIPNNSFTASTSSSCFVARKRAESPEVGQIQLMLLVTHAELLEEIPAKTV
jgi:hypothetical protein